VPVSPFTYEYPVAPADVIDRGEESERLLELVTAGRFVRLLAPRRYGKTSLLRKVLAEADKQGIPTVLVDFYGVVSVAEVAHRIERAYAEQLHGKLRTLAERFLNASGFGVSLGAVGISVSLERTRNPDPVPALHTLLELPLQALIKTGVMPVVVFDEFQDILPIERVDALMRSHIQHHGGKVSYVFSGSEPGMMRELFERRARPMYGQALPERLGRLRYADVAEYIHDRFERTGKRAGETLPSLLGVAQGHPQRAMLLAHHLWQATPQRGSADQGAWKHAIQAAEAEVRDELRAYWRGLQTNDQRALRALSAANGKPYRLQALTNVDLKKSSATHAYERLLDRGDLERTAEEELIFVDPLLERWVHRQGASAG
jgi:hypothetical protein